MHSALYLPITQRTSEITCVVLVFVHSATKHMLFRHKGRVFLADIFVAGCAVVTGDPAVLTCGASVLSLEHSLGGGHDMRRGDAVLVQQRGGRAGARHLLHVHVVDHDVPL